MLGDHWVYIVVVLLVALVVFGPKRLPELGQALGRALNEFRRATQSMGDEVKSVGASIQQSSGPAIPTGSAPHTTTSGEVPAETTVGSPESVG